MSAVAVDVSSKRFAVPFECPCCGAVPDAELEVTVARGGDVGPESARSQWFPYCARCVAHAQAWESAGVGTSGVMVAAIAAGIVVSFTVRLIAGLVVWIGAVPIALNLGAARRKRAKAGCGPSCAGPGTALAYHGWNGNVSSFTFESPTYAARFAEQNAKILVASPPVQQLLERHRIARSAVPTPAIATPAVPPALDVPGWIARIEAAKTRVARRDLVTRALDALHSDDDRRALAAAAAKLERAQLGEDDALAGPAARPRLQRAIADARAANLPEPVQDALLADLERRLEAAR